MKYTIATENNNTHIIHSSFYRSQNNTTIQVELLATQQHQQIDLQHHNVQNNQNIHSHKNTHFDKDKIPTQRKRIPSIP